jgi:FlaA1/EpsC-like NDP-sugar epimerase
MRFKARYLLFLDLMAVLFAATGAFVIRYEALVRIGPYIERNLFFFAAVFIVRPILYYLFGLYRRWWRYASVAELVNIVEAVTVGSVIVSVLVFGFLAPPLGGVRVFSRSIILLEWVLNLLAIGSLRMVVRLWQTRSTTLQSRTQKHNPVRRVLIMGAGDAGALIVREMLNNPALGYLPVGFLDDDPNKKRAKIYGIPVLGTRQDIPHLVRKLDAEEVVIAMPTAPGSAVREVRSICQQSHVNARTLPGLYELINGTVHIGQIREVKIEDLLRRQPVQIDLAAVDSCVAGAVVLVTGAGGSIGSELCRQIAARRPAALLLLGHGENSIYNIWMQLRENHPEIPIQPLLADVRDAGRLERLFLAYRPQVVFHAAAHKHVPLMEFSAEEAFTTNVLGTRNVLRAAEVAGTERLVLISSDKAVNPVNIMGASKCVAEMLVQQAAQRLGRHYVVVRFGNVLGSRGSVIPLFEKQIAAGGPVTVTHPEMRRYFMTIPEAVQLVLQAAAMGQGGNILVLDMGEQIRVVDMARDLISLSGLTSGEDIEIVYTGMRPGEKLYEELFGEGEVRVPTAHRGIQLAQSSCMHTEAKLSQGIDAILDASRTGSSEQLAHALKCIVPNYTPASQVPIPDMPPKKTAATVPCLSSATHAPARP